MISGINYQSRGKGYQPKLKAKADNPYRDLYYSGYHVISKVHCTLSQIRKEMVSSMYHNLCYLPTVSFDQL